LTNTQTLNEQLSDLGAAGKDSIDELRRSTGRKLDDARSETAEALHAAASSVRSTGRQGSEAIDHIADTAADRLDATAAYVEENDFRDAFGGLRRFCRRHLTGTLLAAGVAGFVAGCALSRAAHSSEKSAR
jgi:hypothetical protein